MSDAVMFEAAFRRWYGPIRGWVYNVTSDFDLAQTIASDTFVRAWRAWPAFQQRFGTASVAAWLWRIARRLLADAGRKRHRRRRFTWVDLDDQWHVPSLHDDIGVADRWVELEAAWPMLSEHQQDALRLAALGYDDIEGSAALGVSRGAYRAAVLRARRALERVTS